MTTNEHQINSYRDKQNKGKMKRNRKHCEMANMYVISQFCVNNINTTIESVGSL